MIPQGGLPENSELVGFELEEEPSWITVKLEDGSVIKIKMEIVAIIKGGNDPNTGLPLYMVQATNIIRMNKVPKELIKKGQKYDENKGQSLYR